MLGRRPFDTSAELPVTKAKTWPLLCPLALSSSPSPSLELSPQMIWLIRSAAGHDRRTSPPACVWILVIINFVRIRGTDKPWLPRDRMERDSDGGFAPATPDFRLPAGLRYSHGFALGRSTSDPWTWSPYLHRTNLPIPRLPLPGRLGCRPVGSWPWNTHTPHFPSPVIESTCTYSLRKGPTVVLEGGWGWTEGNLRKIPTPFGRPKLVRRYHPMWTKRMCAWLVGQGGVIFTKSSVTSTGPVELWWSYLSQFLQSAVHHTNQRGAGIRFGAGWRRASCFQPCRASKRRRGCCISAAASGGSWYQYWLGQGSDPARGAEPIHQAAPHV